MIKTNLSASKTVSYPVVLLSLFFLWMVSCKETDNTTEKRQSIPVALATAEIRDLSIYRETTAPVVAYQRVYITARTAGQVTAVHFEEGDIVSKGDLLARLDTRRQEARLRRAEAIYKETRSQYDRNRKLFEAGMIPEAEYQAFARQLEEAEAEAALLKVEVELGSIYTPINAVVSARLIEVGTTVAENQRLFTIEDHNTLVARPGLSEKDVVHLERGQNVNMSFDIYPDVLFNGKVRRIFPAADPLTRLFTVEVEIDQRSAPHRIVPGYLSRIHFATDLRPDAVTIPPEALYKDNGDFYVFMIQEDKAVKKRIEPGIRRDGWIEVLQGLEGGEQLAAANLENLKDGSQVEIRGVLRRYGFRD